MLFKELRETKRKERMAKILIVCNLVFVFDTIRCAMKFEVVACCVFFALVFLDGFYVYHLTGYVIPDLDEENLKEYTDMLDKCYNECTIREYSNTILAIFNISNITGLKENYVEYERNREFRNNLIRYADNMKPGFFSEDDDIKEKMVARLSAFLIAIIKYPVLKDDAFSAHCINIAIMEKVILNFMKKFENYIDIDMDKITKVSWYRYLDVATSLPRDKAYDYIFNTILYDGLEKEEEKFWIEPSQELNE